MLAIINPVIKQMLALKNSKRNNTRQLPINTDSIINIFNSSKQRDTRISKLNKI